jgi:hypothetical protein
VAHTCNPSYSGGRDQEDHSARPSLANSSKDPTSKKNHKRAGGMAEVVGLPSKHKALNSNPSTKEEGRGRRGGGGGGPRGEGRRKRYSFDSG